jgi:hypothetical protein
MWICTFGHWLCIGFVFGITDVAVSSISSLHWYPSVVLRGEECYNPSELSNVLVGFRSVSCTDMSR